MFLYFVFLFGELITISEDSHVNLIVYENLNSDFFNQLFFLQLNTLVTM